MKDLMSRMSGFLDIIPSAESSELGSKILYNKLNEYFRLLLDVISTIQKYAIKERNRELNFVVHGSLPTVMRA